jgi:hypothetical protein
VTGKPQDTSRLQIEGIRGSSVYGHNQSAENIVIAKVIATYQGRWGEPCGHAECGGLALLREQRMSRCCHCRRKRAAENREVALRGACAYYEGRRKKNRGASEQAESGPDRGNRLLPVRTNLFHRRYPYFIYRRSPCWSTCVTLMDISDILASQVSKQ